MQLQTRSACGQCCKTVPLVAKPYALLLYERVQHGATVDDLWVETGIPRERLIQRLRAAAVFVRRKATA